MREGYFTTHCMICDEEIKHIIPNDALMYGFSPEICDKCKSALKKIVMENKERIRGKGI